MYNQMASKVLQKLERNYGRTKNQILIANGIFDFIDILVGPEEAPYVAKRLTTISQPEIREYLKSFTALRDKVRSAQAKKRIRLNKAKGDKKDDADAEGDKKVESTEDVKKEDKVDEKKEETKPKAAKKEKAKKPIDPEFDRAKVTKNETTGEFETKE